MKCEKCGKELGNLLDLKMWTITIGDKVKTFHVCVDCKDKFIEWMRKNE